MAQQHKDLTGSNLHNSKLEIVNTDPQGNKSPVTEGYLIHNQSNQRLYIALGTTTSDWLTPITRSESNLVNYNSITVKDELDNLQKDKTDLFNYNSVSLDNNGRLIGQFDINQYRRADYQITIRNTSNGSIYANKITVIQNQSTINFKEFDIVTIGDSESVWKNTYYLAFSVQINNNNAELKVLRNNTGTLGVDITSYQQKL